MKNQKLMILAAALGSIAAAACGSSGSNTTTTIPPVTTYVQVDRLGRPAVNEGLVYTNAYLNAFNSIPPSADLSAAAAPVVTEAAGVITGTWELTHGNSAAEATSAAAFVGDIAAEFLPDVLRIDTTKAIPQPGQAYASNFAGPVGPHSHVGILTGGRKLEDPVIADTLTVLTGEFGTTTVSDGVTYKGGTISTGIGTTGANPQQGHKMLHGATAYGGTATFPYLAKPN